MQSSNSMQKVGSRCGWWTWTHRGVGHHRSSRLRLLCGLAVLCLWCLPMRAATAYLSWDNDPHALRYKVWRSVGQNSFSLTMLVTTNMAADFGIVTNVSTASDVTNYMTRWFITTVNDFGESIPSLTVTNIPSLTLPTTNPPAIYAPSNLRATMVSGNRTDLSWVNSPDYWTQMERAVNGGPWMGFEILPPGVLHTTTRIRKGATFEFRCRSQDVWGNLSEYSNSVVIYAQ